MKSMIFSVVTMLTFAVSPIAFADSNCAAVLSQDDNQVGGGGISGVGGGNSNKGFAVFTYINSAHKETFPQLVILQPLADGNVKACVYDKHFGQANTPRLVGTLACEGGKTIKWPYDQNLRVSCAGKIDTYTLTFEAAYLKPELIATMRRQQASGSYDTEAILIGH